MAFADVFTFTRGGPAGYTNAQGQAAVAAANTPRFDYAAGAPLGLLVQGAPETLQPDQVAANEAGWMAVTSAGTVLHTLLTPQGETLRRAIYTEQPQAVINDLLRSKGHHQRITFFDSQLPEAGGQVGWRGNAYTLAGTLGASDAVSLVYEESGGLISTGAPS